MKREQMLKHIATVVCNKNYDITFVECYDNSQANGGICFDYNRCIIDEKSDEQLEYIISSRNDNTYLEACPGSGKTEVVGIKSAYEISQWSNECGGIAILSFTKNSANVIAERISKFLGSLSSEFPHFIGTIDSWIHSYISQPFGHLISEYPGKDGDRKITLIDESSISPWLNSLNTFDYFLRNKRGINVPIKVLPNKISYDVENEEWIFKVPTSGVNINMTAQKYYDSLAVQEYVKQYPNYTVEKVRDKLRDCKNSFIKKGYATYNDMEVICHHVLDRKKGVTKRIAKRFPLLLVDEAQDLSWLQIEILRMLQEYGVKIHLIGDINQAIYSFKKVNPQNVKDFVSTNFKKLKLNTNYRSCKDIVNTCSKILDIESTSFQHTNDIIDSCLVYSYDETKMEEIPLGYQNLLEENNIKIDDSAIVARGWGLIRKITNSTSKDLNKKEYALSTAIRIYEPEINENLSYSLELLGLVLAATLCKSNNTSRQHFYKPDVIESNIKWRKFLYTLLSSLSKNPRIRDLSQTWSKWCTVLKKEFLPHIILAANIADIDNFLEENIKKYEHKFRSPTGFAKLEVFGIAESPHDKYSDIRKTTIHQVKGETLSSILVLSTEKNTGKGEGYWKKWLLSTENEIGRFAYVASSRPKDLLVWVIPQESVKEIELLENRGFKFKGSINDLVTRT